MPVMLIYWAKTILNALKGPEVQCKQWDTIDRVNECTLIDNIFL